MANSEKIALPPVAKTVLLNSIEMSTFSSIFKKSSLPNLSKTCCNDSRYSVSISKSLSIKLNPKQSASFLPIDDLPAPVSYTHLTLPTKQAV